MDISGAFAAGRLVLLRFDDDTLKFFKDRKLLVRRVDLGVSLLFAGEKTDLFKFL